MRLKQFFIFTITFLCFLNKIQSEEIYPNFYLNPNCEDNRICGVGVAPDMVLALINALTNIAEQDREITKYYMEQIDSLTRSNTNINIKTPNGNINITTLIEDIINKNSFLMDNNFRYQGTNGRIEIAHSITEKNENFNEIITITKNNFTINELIAELELNEIIIEEKIFNNNLIFLKLSTPKDKWMKEEKEKMGKDWDEFKLKNVIENE